MQLNKYEEYEDRDRDMDMDWNSHMNIARSTSGRRGFAVMDEQRQREIASRGGRTAHAKGTAHEFTSQEAVDAGRKGGHAAHAKGTAHEFTPQEAAEAGRKGGRTSHKSGIDIDIDIDMQDSNEDARIHAQDFDLAPWGS